VGADDAGQFFDGVKQVEHGILKWRGAFHFYFAIERVTSDFARKLAA
jgi:hypothetical protein